MARTTQSEFLEILFGDLPGPGREIVVWTDQKRTTWCEGAEAAAEATAKANESADVYFGVSLQSKELAVAEARRLYEEDELARVAKGEERRGDPPSPSRVRGYSRTAQAIGGVWVDFDVAGPGHDKQGLPESREAITACLAALPLRASRVVDTGGGVHAWWFLREPWTLETDDEREVAQRRVRGWQQLCERVGRFKLDATHDLARVLRLPGTRSKKHGGHVVRVVSASEAVYNPGDFEPYESSTAQVRRSVASFSGLVVDSDAQPPADKLALLGKLDAKFTATWTRRRKDLQSQSEHDFSLASLAIAAGWSDQEVVDLIVAHRRTGDVTGQLLADVADRPGYFKLTLSKLRGDPQLERARERIEVRNQEVAESGTAAAPRTPTDAARELRDLSVMLGFPVRRIVRYAGDPPSFKLELPGGSPGQITLGSVNAILEPGIFRQFVAAATGLVTRRYKAFEWDGIAQAILRCCVDVDLGNESQALSATGELVRAFLAAQPPYSESSFEDALRQRRPFRDEEGRPCIWLVEMLGWARIHGGDIKLTRMQLAKGIRDLGGEHFVIGYTRPDGRRTTAQAWRLPANVEGELAPANESPTGGD